MLRLRMLRFLEVLFAGFLGRTQTLQCQGLRQLWASCGRSSVVQDPGVLVPCAIETPTATELAILILRAPHDDRRRYPKKALF